MDVRTILMRDERDNAPDWRVPEKAVKRTGKAASLKDGENWHGKCFLTIGLRYRRNTGKYAGTERVN